MGWNNARKTEPPSSSAGKYLKFDDGTKATIIPLGVPHRRRQHWTGVGYVDCEGKGCPHCADPTVDDARDSYEANVWHVELGCCQIIGMSQTLWNMFSEEMAEVEDDGGDPDKMAYRISRKGLREKTRWKVRAHRPATAPDRVELHPLQGVPVGEVGPSTPADDELPV